MVLPGPAYSSHFKMIECQLAFREQLWEKNYGGAGLGQVADWGQK